MTATGLLVSLVAPQIALAQPPATAPTKPAVDSATYRINAGDQIEIYVWGDERLQRALTVLPDGSFAFPLVGTVQAQGRTPQDIEGEISRRLAEQYKGEAPQVTVSVKTPSGNQISVIGKVRSPGTFASSRNINVLDALTLAGGPTEFADVGNVVILRHENGKTTSFHVQLSNVLKGRPSARDLSANGIPELRAGDTVIVP
jgi:polysaccharide export outer membrane protein